MIPELVRTWVAGWAVSRRTPQPVELPWGLYLDIGRPTQLGRHVLPEAEESAVRAAVEAVTVPHTWITVPMEPGRRRPGCPAAGWRTRRSPGT